MTYSCSGVILAGGLSKRFNGRDKAFVQVGRKDIVTRLLDIFNDLFEEKILVTNDPMKYLCHDAKLASDVFPIRSSLTGLQAGLFFAATPYAFIAACDTPFLKKGVIEILLENIEPGIDVIIPETASGLEPLCAVYSKKCLIPAENNLRRHNFKIQQFFKKVRVKKILEKELRKQDPDLISFFNINSPADLETAEKIEADEFNRRRI
ncbi:MAG: molybdenum cofactor guanylyltransferase [Desulfobacterales bacterium]|jgi:molybdopterin-guanine dinucleotide biosynthesis protein A